MAKLKTFAIICNGQAGEILITIEIRVFVDSRQMLHHRVPVLRTFSRCLSGTCMCGKTKLKLETVVLTSTIKRKTVLNFLGS
jgi:hypothetical protein